MNPADGDGDRCGWPIAAMSPIGTSARGAGLVVGNIMQALSKAN